MMNGKLNVPILIRTKTEPIPPITKTIYALNEQDIKPVSME